MVTVTGFFISKNGSRNQPRTESVRESNKKIDAVAQDFGNFIILSLKTYSYAFKNIFTKCLHVVVLYITISPSHRNTPMTNEDRNICKGDDHEHFNFHKTGGLR